ncbi:RHS repeat-associated core domain-containing protein [Nonomuraea thailandensis]
MEFLATDNQGSVQLSVPAGATAAAHVRSYQPYGRPGGTDRTATDRGWIGQIEDASTGLSYLNARYYDPSMGRFVSPDPLFDVARPQTLNPYAYGLNNPTAFSDPSGLIPDACAFGEVKCSFNGKGWINVQPVPSTPDPPPAAQELCAPGSSGNNHPACGPRRERATITGDEDLTVEDLAERVNDGTDTALDVTELGMELCTDSLGCAQITEFVEMTDGIGYATGALGVVIDCESEGWTSQACVKGAILEGGQLIPGWGSSSSPWTCWTSSDSWIPSSTSSRSSSPATAAAPYERVTPAPGRNTGARTCPAEGRASTPGRPGCRRRARAARLRKRGHVR